MKKILVTSLAVLMSVVTVPVMAQDTGGLEVLKRDLPPPPKPKAVYTSKNTSTKSSDDAALGLTLVTSLVLLLATLIDAATYDDDDGYYRLAEDTDLQNLEALIMQDVN